MTDASRIVVSYPADLSAWGRDRVDCSEFRAYLRKTRAEAAEGDRWDEFVGVGCCGDSLDVPLRVEAVEGGDALGAETTVEFTVREACGLDGNWQVQSEGGPRTPASE